MRLVTLSLPLLFSIHCCGALDNGLARTPPMGWMSWQRFRCQTNCALYPEDCISEALIKRTANRLVSDGWKDVGYRYLIIDDCWQAMERDRVTEQIVADPTRFPHGIEAVGEYIHYMGLLFGIYLDYGTKTCEGFPGSMDYLETDAKSLAKWKVDYVKVDGCYSPEERMPLGYEDFGKYINQTGRPIVYSCSYPAYIGWQANHSLIEWERLKKNCNLWRMLSDVQDSWDSVMSIINVYKEHGSLLTSVAGPGHWNDPDMLVVGNYGLSKDQQRVQMGMWCMLAAPLLLSVDLDNIDEFSAELLKNPHLLAINQDPGGHQAKLVKVKQEVMMWSRKLESEPRTWAITFLYTVGGGGPIRVPTTLNEMALDGLNSTLDIYFTLTDVFDGSVFGKVKKAESFFVQVNPSGLAMYHVRGEERPRFEHLTLLGFVHIEANV